jgi:hypothetical protein
VAETSGRNGDPHPGYRSAALLVVTYLGCLSLLDLNHPALPALAAVED